FAQLQANDDRASMQSMNSLPHEPSQFDHHCKRFAQLQANDDRAIMQSMNSLLQQGWLKGDDGTDRFLRIAVTVCFDRCLAGLEGPGPDDYTQIDCLAKFIVILVRYFEEWSRSTTMSKLGLVNK
ncbi:hypothetical protein T484DRAFT_1832144, partial [Baffinella frigidus]